MTYRVHKTFTLDDNNCFDREEMSLTFGPSCVGDMASRMIQYSYAIKNGIVL